MNSSSLEICSNRSEDIAVSPQAGSALSKLDEKISSIMGEVRSVRFRFTVIPQTYYSAETPRNKEALREKLEAIDAKLVENLFEEMAKDEPWLSGCYEILENGDKRCFFNYNKRFNRYESGWKYQEESTFVSPKRAAIVRFFDRKNQKVEPKWVTALRYEEELVQNFLEDADPEVVYRESLEEPVLQHGSSILRKVWDVTSELYERFLLSERGLLEFFIDGELVSKQSKAIKRMIEDPILEELLENAVEWWGAEALFELSDDLYLSESLGASDYSGCLPDEFDEMLEDHFGAIVKAQTSRRFPDLGF